MNSNVIQILDIFQCRYANVKFANTISNSSMIVFVVQSNH